MLELKNLGNFSPLTPILLPSLKQSFGSSPVSPSLVIEADDDDEEDDDDDDDDDDVVRKFPCVSPPPSCYRI